MAYGGNKLTKIKPDSRHEKGWNDLIDSLYSICHMAWPSFNIAIKPFL